MAQIPNPENTFRTHLGDDAGLSQRTIRALNNHAWYAWQPGADFPYQAGSGYGDMNEYWDTGNPAMYNTHRSLGRSSTVAQDAQKQAAWGNLWYAIKRWWAGKEGA